MACIGKALSLFFFPYLHFGPPEDYFTAVQLQKVGRTVFNALDDGTGVLLNVETMAYYSLNKTAAHLWKLIEEVKTVSLDDLVMLTCERYEVSPEDARLALLAFIDRLEQYKMIRLG